MVFAQHEDVKMLKWKLESKIFLYINLSIYELVG